VELQYLWDRSPGPQVGAHFYEIQIAEEADWKEEEEEEEENSLLAKIGVEAVEAALWRLGEEDEEAVSHENHRTSAEGSS